MKKSELKQNLRKYKKEALSCLYPNDGDYAWGSTKKNKQKSVELMQKLLSEIPENVWPIKDDVDGGSDYVFINDGNWKLKLFWCGNKRHADLIFANDDHTAWVRQNKNGVWVDFDIGGS